MKLLGLLCEVCSSEAIGGLEPFASMKPLPQASLRSLSGRSSEVLCQCGVLRVLVVQDGSSKDTLSPNQHPEKRGPLTKEYPMKPLLDGIPSIQNQRQRLEASLNDLGHEQNASAVVDLLHLDKAFVRQQQELMDQILARGSPRNSQQVIYGSERKASILPSNQVDGEDKHKRRRSKFPATNQDSSSRFSATLATSHLASYWHQDVGSESDDEDGFLSFINDPSIIREQRRIMHEIFPGSLHSASESSCSSHRFESPFPHHLWPLASVSSLIDSEDDDDGGRSNEIATKTAGLEDVFLGYMEQAAERSCTNRTAPPTLDRSAGRRPPMQSQLPSVSSSLDKLKVSSTGSNSVTSNNNDQAVAPCEQDATVELYKGKNLRLRGTNHTWKHIAKGQAIVVQCPACHCILQVGSAAKLLYCTNCEEVSPIAIVNIWRKVTKSTPGLLLSCSNMKSTWPFARKWPTRMRRDDANCRSSRVL